MTTYNPESVAKQLVDLVAAAKVEPRLGRIEFIVKAIEKMVRDKYEYYHLR